MANHVLAWGGEMVRVVLRTTLLVMSVFVGGSLAGDEIDEDYLLVISSAEVSDTTGFTLDFTVDNSAGEVLEGWQWGVCHDPDILELVSESIDQEGLDDQDLEFEFHDIVIEFDSGDPVGWTVICTLSSLLGSVLPVSDDAGHLLYSADYVVVDQFLGPEEDSIATSVDWCDTLGTPSIATEVLVDGRSVGPAREDGEITIAPFPEAYRCTLSGPGDEDQIRYSPFDGLRRGSGDVTISIAQIPDVLEEGIDTQGLQFGIRHDDTLIEPIEVGVVGVLADLDEGNGPCFVGTNLNPEDGPGFTVGIVYDLMGGLFLSIGVDDEAILTVTYDTVAELLVDVEDEDTLTDLTWQTYDDPLGEPPLPNRVVVDGREYSLENDTLHTLTLHPATGFLRGDANGNGDTFAIVDALYILEWGFNQGPEPPCMDAADTNGDNVVFAIVDALYLLVWGFNPDGPAPPDPGPDVCGTDPDDDDVTCLVVPDECP